MCVWKIETNGGLEQGRPTPNSREEGKGKEEEQEEKEEKEKEEEEAEEAKWRTYPYARSSRVVVRVELMCVVGQYVQPAHLAVHVPPFRVADRVPDARQPVGDQRERGHEQQQHGRAVLRVPVDLPGHPHQPQQPGRLQQADQRGRLQAQTRLGQSSVRITRLERFRYAPKPTTTKPLPFYCGFHKIKTLRSVCTHVTHLFFLPPSRKNVLRGKKKIRATAIFKYETRRFGLSFWPKNFCWTTNKNNGGKTVFL